MKTLKYFSDRKGRTYGKVYCFPNSDVVFRTYDVYVNFRHQSSSYGVGRSFLHSVYASILGSAFWEEGAKDRIKADGGRIKKDVLAGLKIALVPYSPTILLTAVFAVLKANPGLFESATSILNILLKILLSGVYVPFDIGLFDNSGDSIIGFRYLGYCVITLGSALVSYLMGFNGFGEKKSSKR